VELRDYVAAVQRRWPIVAIVTLLAILVGAFFTLRGPRAYESTIRLAVSAGADARGDTPPYVYYRDYYAWLSSEYLADDLSEIIKSDAFATDVKQALNQNVESGAIRQVIRTKKTHRILEVTVQASTEEQTARLATAIDQVIQTQGKKYLAQLASPNNQIARIDEPAVHPATTTSSVALDIGLRGLVGLLAGLLLAAAAEYLDSRLTSAREVERSLGLRVLGEIPAH
jgi:succinoglycan biosynthesis transport protein ExoP